MRYADPTQGTSLEIPRGRRGNWAEDRLGFRGEGVTGTRGAASHVHDASATERACVGLGGAGARRAGRGRGGGLGARGGAAGRESAGGGGRARGRWAMSATFRLISWTPYKKRYDLVMVGVIVAYL